MKKKILYVEDEPFLGRIVKESLESRDFDVTMQEDGAMVKETFASSTFDICILDIMLPSRDGYSLAQEIRQANPEVPIIFVSAKTQTPDLLKGFESGGDDYIRKPFSIEELIVRIENLLRLKQHRKRTAHAGIVSIGSYEFVPSRYELRRNSSVKKISNREANLLTLLEKNRNGITNRKDILLQVWGDDSFFNSRNLDVYITRLRELLKEDPSIEIITIKGVGYHFAVGHE